jgi:hypothetical protein
MNQFVEAAVIALGAIWSNKLRSFLTVLGNIVAVTSIIAVVSLIQGMNGYVTNAIVSDVGADNFTIQRYPVVRTQEDEERIRNNPRITMKEAAAIRRFSDNVGSVAGQVTSAGTMAYGNQSIDGAQVQGVSREYIAFSTFTAEYGRLISPVEIDSNRPVTVLGGRQNHDDPWHSLPRGRRQQEEGIRVRQLAGQLRDHPARSVPENVRVANGPAAAARQTEDTGSGRGGHGRRDGGHAHRAPVAAVGAG